MVESFRVLLVDNEEVFREGLAKLLGDQSHIEVVCQSGRGIGVMGTGIGWHTWHRRGAMARGFGRGRPGR